VERPWSAPPGPDQRRRRGRRRRGRRRRGVRRVERRAAVGRFDRQTGRWCSAPTWPRTPPHPDANWSLQTQRGPVIAGSRPPTWWVRSAHRGGAGAVLHRPGQRRALRRRGPRPGRAPSPARSASISWSRSGRAPPPRPTHAPIRADPLGSVPAVTTPPARWVRVPAARPLPPARRDRPVFYATGSSRCPSSRQRGTLDWASVPNGSPSGSTG